MERSFATEKVGGRYGELSLLADDHSQGKQAEDEVLFLDRELLGAGLSKDGAKAKGFSERKQKQPSQIDR